MKSYFEAYDKHEEKETAIALPNRYGFYISYNDTELKQRVYLDHRCIPISLLKYEKKHKSDDVLITITLKETVYKFTITYKDFFQYLKPVFEPSTQIDFG